MGDMQGFGTTWQEPHGWGRRILLQILCWLRFLIQCFSECTHSPTEIEPYALGVTVICLILNKISEKHASQASSLWTLCPTLTSVPAGVGEDVEDVESDLGISWRIG